MPVIPSFSGYAIKPNLAEAFLGGQRNQLQALQLQQAAQESQARIALGYQQIESQRAQNEAQLAATQAAKEQAFLLDQQRLAIDKAYKDAQVGFEERQLQETAAVNDLKFSEAARKFAAEQEFFRRVKNKEDPAKVFMEVGPLMGYNIPSSAYKQPEPVPQIPPKVGDVQGQRFYQPFVGGEFKPIPEDQAQIVEREQWRRNVDMVESELKSKRETRDKLSASGYPEGFKPKLPNEIAMMEVVNGIIKEIKELEAKREKLMNQAPIKADIPFSGIMTNAAGTNVVKRFRYDPQTKSLIPLN